MKFLTAAEFANPTELKTREEPTPELGEDTGVIVREIGAADRVRLQEEFGDDVKLKGAVALRFRGKLLRASLATEEGRLMFESDDELEAVIGHRHDLIERLSDITLELCGMGGSEDGDSDEEDEPEAVKNSGSGG